MTGSSRPIFGTTASKAAGLDLICVRRPVSKVPQKQTRNAATFDTVWRFSEHHTNPYVSGSDVSNVL
jgi:hypothetical protein